MTQHSESISRSLLDWYDRHHRHLPWRVPPGPRRGDPDPYHVWLSEIMLQQTTVQAVRPYFASFLEQWPDVSALAAASEEDVLKAWAGLGYYSRARNLKKCAETLMREHGGIFPTTETALRALPGIGDYTAAAIAAIAFDVPAAVVDGNVERVLSRLRFVETPLPGAKSEIRSIMAELTPKERPGDFAQAMMDLGSMVCTPKRPTCGLCPLNGDCLVLGRDDPERLPIKPPKKARPVRRGAAFVAIDGNKSVLLRRRGARGMLAGMSEVPTSNWSARQDGALGVEAAPFAATWKPTGTIRHVFTHFELRLDVYRADINRRENIDGGWWVEIPDLQGEALPTVMKKAITAAIETAFQP